MTNVFSQGDELAIRYQLFDEAGNQIASNLADTTPQQLFLGRGQMLPAVEEYLAQMEIGETKTFTLPPEKAFGYTNEALVKKTLLHKIPEPLRKEGNIIDLEDKENNITSARIHAITPPYVLLDFNHPLAGQTIKFTITLIKAISQQFAKTAKDNIKNARS